MNAAILNTLDGRCIFCISQPTTVKRVMEQHSGRGLSSMSSVNRVRRRCLRDRSQTFNPLVTIAQKIVTGRTPRSPMQQCRRCGSTLRQANEPSWTETRPVSASLRVQREALQQRHQSRSLGFSRRQVWPGQVKTLRSKGHRY